MEIPDAPGKPCFPSHRRGPCARVAVSLPFRSRRRPVSAAWNRAVATENPGLAIDAWQWLQTESNEVEVIGLIEKLGGLFPNRFAPSSTLSSDWWSPRNARRTRPSIIQLKRPLVARSRWPMSPVSTRRLESRRHSPRPIGRTTLRAELPVHGVLVAEETAGGCRHRSRPRGR